MAKTFKNVFDKALTINELEKAYYMSRKGKIYKKDVILFSLKQEEYIKKIYCKLLKGNYTFGKHKLFYIYEPKKRRILAAPFRDRIVHTWYVNSFLIPYFISSFIQTSDACIKGKGTHMCAKEVKKRLDINIDTYPNEYILKLDVRKFFENIDRTILFKILSKKISDKKFIKLTQNILDSTNSIYGKLGGIPIGNYTSQMFANIYLNKLDRYAKDILKCKWYYRYMDDIVIFLDDKEQAKKVLKSITEFVNSKLELELNNKTEIFKIKQGVNFCGYKISKNGIKIRDRTKKKLTKRLKELEYLLINNKITTKECSRSLSGYKGYMCHITDYRLIQKLFFTK